MSNYNPNFVDGIKATAKELDLRMDDPARPADDASEAMAAIEIALELTEGNHDDAIDVIAYAEKVSGSAKSMAYETLENALRMAGRSGDTDNLENEIAADRLSSADADEWDDER